MPDHTIAIDAETEAIITETKVGGVGQPATLDLYMQGRADGLSNEAKIKSRDRRWDALSVAQKDAALTAGEAA
jgi:hypothetical protein